MSIMLKLAFKAINMNVHVTIINQSLENLLQPNQRKLSLSVQGTKHVISRSITGEDFYPANDTLQCKFD